MKSICQIGAGLSDSTQWFDAHQMKSVFVIVKYQILFFFLVLRVSPWNQIVPLLGMEYLKIWFDTHLWSDNINFLTFFLILPPFENDSLFSWIWYFLGKFVFFHVNANCTLTQVRQFLQKRIHQNNAKRLKSKQTLLSLHRKYLHK